ncbi:membrane protein insertion efficiency factor YidD [Paucibacter sp. KBW04]|uniref:membrane protein insertion efficiency factor YidD n=1 Tax=Paucibacter sp. KBW04 TaxID=2153361 RepID=UPI000F569DAC|nr:membrane protein insertion efficiency factor YidD [Paucibacter sp. KBW04]RQO55902.1 membrane protein insertion efficiency factor YidD [Paucibacter sp. KBW04]
MRLFALCLIRAYQRWLSPHKGFSCAYRVHCGRASCSALGYRVIRRYGCWQGLALLRQRLQLCGLAHRRYGVLPSPRLSLAGQRGLCDPGCDLPCDLPGGHTSCDVCDAFSCFDCCDWPSRKTHRRQSPRERWAERRRHLPPKKSPNQAPTKPLL